ncbi:MAG: Nif3-like dinuclear metal center hexameric protein [Planctomycetota bacterium]|nr:Nif3-like dinuclear metal center hexameric protein [Planctomycetota bacterium]
MPIVADLIDLLNEIAPPELALPDDRNGLSAGSPRQPVKHLVLALDATAEVLNAAPAGALVITHHPRFYQPIRNLTADNFYTPLAALALKKNLALFNAHTNLDIAPDGVNDHLAEIIGLTAPQIVSVTHRCPTYKLTVFAPTAAAEKVSAAIGAAGAGQMGEYRDCCYRVAGRGQFRPSANANPFIGKRGELTSVDEIRLETVVKHFDRPRVEAALRRAHPYEEPAFDFIALDRTENFGLGRVGTLRVETLNTPVKFSALVKHVQKTLGSVGLLFDGDADRRVATAAVWSGSGVAADALTGVDAVIAGEIDYHRAEILRQKNVCLIAAGHAASEWHILEVLRKKIAAAMPTVKITVAEMPRELRGNIGIKNWKRRPESNW